VFFAALASAGLHASWNVIAKRQRIPSEAVLGIILTTALVCLVAVPFIGLPPVLAVAGGGGDVQCGLLARADGRL
jgi:hypothetical protein